MADQAASEIEHAPPAVPQLISAMHRAVGERFVAGSHTHKAGDWGEWVFIEGSCCASQISSSSKLVPTTGKAMSNLLFLVGQQLPAPAAFSEALSGNCCQSVDQQCCLCLSQTVRYHLQKCSRSCSILLLHKTTIPQALLHMHRSPKWRWWNCNAHKKTGAW